MPTPPCSAITKAGSPCGKVTGTQPDPTTGEPRCWTHLAKAKRLQDPGSRPPVRNPKTTDDVKRLLTWAINRAAQDDLHAPSANATASLCKVWLKVHADQTDKAINLWIDAALAVQEMNASWDVPPARRTAYDAAHARFQEAMDRLRELQPVKRESSDEATARRQRREAQEALRAANPDNTPLDDEVSDILEDPTAAPEIEDL